MKKETNSIKHDENSKIIKEAVERLLDEIVQLKSFVKLNLEALNYYIS